MATTLAKFARLKHTSYVQGGGIFLADFLAYAVAIAGTIAVSSIGLRIACGTLAGGMISILLIVAHDACHHSLTPNRWLNRLLGTLAFLPSLHAYSLWRYEHNVLHHLYTNVRGGDRIWEPLSPREFRALSWCSQIRYRFYRSPVGHLTYYFFEIWWKLMFLPWRRYLPEVKPVHRIDAVIVLAWLTALSLAAVILRCRLTGAPLDSPGNWVGPLCLTVVWPIIFSSMLMSSTDFLQHTHPRIHWYNEAATGDWMVRQSRCAVHCRLPRIIDRRIHWILDHTAHHMQPAIPSYVLRQAQRSVESERGDEVVAYHWSLRIHLEILRACKLYDDEAGCWTDFEGRPTSSFRRPVSTQILPPRHCSASKAA